MLIISSIGPRSEPVELDGTPTSSERTKNGGQNDPSPEEIEQRARLMLDRKGDKGVLVDIPGTPSAEEFGRSEDAEANTTNVSTSQ